MAAFLYPGVKSLQLVLDRPYDSIRTTDVRDDLTSVKVWYSLTSGFNPNNGEGTLVPSGNSLNVTIPNLTPNTRYYVKYAFISAIDEDEVDPAGPTGPGSYTVSAQLTAVVLEENISVYGYLTNDPVPIVTATDGTGGNFSQATGVFKVFNLSTEVTGAGPVYSIKSGSIDSIVGATINATTGVYSCTGLTADGGNVTFRAVYNNVVIEQVWNVYRALAGETAPLIQLSTPNKEFIYKDQFATVSQTPSTTVTARLVNLTGTPTFTVQAYTRDNVTTPLGNIAFTQNGNSITITRAQFDALGITIGTAVVTATIGDVSDVLTLYRINDGTDQITVYLSNESHGIPAYTDGTTTASSYIGSGTTIQVKQGNTYLLVDNTSPFDNGTWTITNIAANGITCDTTPLVTFNGGNFIEFDRHSDMDDDKDSAYIDYTITGKTTTGVAFSIVKRQSFTKSKEGVAGATARSVSLTASRQSFTTEKNSTVVAPETITLTAIQSNFVNPNYVWTVDSGLGFVTPGVEIGAATGNTFVLKKFNPLGVKVVKVTVSEGTFSVFDTFSVYSFREGDDAFIVGLKNENQTISCDSAGDVLPGQFPFTTQMYAVLGERPLSSTTTPAPVFAPVSYNGGFPYSITQNGIITIEGLDEQFGEAVFSATVNGITLTKTVNLNKSFDGSDASVVNVTASTQAFIAAKNTETISPSTITLTATAYNVGAAPTYAWSTSTNGGTTFTPRQTSTSPTYSLASFSSGTTIVKVVVTGGVSTVFDQITIYALKDGSDSIAVGLTNENQTISCDSDGIPIAGQFNLNSELLVFRGATRLTAADGVSWSKVSETGMTSSIITTTGAITITGISAVSASATYRAAVTINGVVSNFDKVFTLNKSNNGLTGEGTTQIYIRTSGTPVAPPASAGLPSSPVQWYASIATTPGTEPLWTSFGTRSAGSNIYTWQTPVRVEGTTVINPPLKNATGYLYYDTASSSAPGTPQASPNSYNFTTGVFGSAGSGRQYFTGITVGWSTTFAIPNEPTGKMWAVRYSVQETVSGGAQTIQISDPFTHQNFNGLVTFTNIDTQVANTQTISNLNSTINTKVDTNGAKSAANVAIGESTVIAGKVSAADLGPSGTTVIDGGRITTGVVNANRLNIGNNSGNLNGDRIVIDGTAITGNNIKVYSAGNLRVVIGNLG
jgi:hypothetical protein